ncbi:hypothetical protein [Arachidicoccus ginsenosidimutans]|uniref:hypothetical protein n=1 Tax=Arachidicoccus sp. BS20 TaxID=1850526 RepID=UPI0012E7D3C9|nr:hypothetical protein [Arachidicoccus sp. BS20]
MQTIEKKIKKQEPVKQVLKIKVNKKLDNIEDAPFFKKKMAKANKILSAAKLPE